MLRSVPYAQERLNFFEAELKKAERRLDWAKKHGRDYYVCSELGNAVSFYPDVVEMLRRLKELEERKWQSG